MALSSSDDMCGFCQSVNDQMIMPRRLPCCTHVFCTQCLVDNQTTTGQGDSITCSMCRSTCDLPAGSWTSLELVVYSKRGSSLYSADKLQLEMKCSLCDDGEGSTSAEVFCPDCNKTLCTQHHQEHNQSSFFKSHTKTMSITAYSERADKYKTRSCLHHDQPLQFQCRSCKQCGCCKCASQPEVGCNLSGGHDYEALNVLEFKVSAELKDLIRSANDKQNEIRNMQKGISRLSSNLDEEYNEKKNSLLATKQQQLDALEKKWSKEENELTKGFEQAQRDLTGFNEEIIEPAVDELAEWTARIGSSLRQQHIVDLLQSKDNLCSEMNERIGRLYTLPDAQLPMIDMRDDVELMLPLTVRRRSQDLHFITSVDVEGSTWPVTHTPDGLIITGHEQGLTIRHPDGQPIDIVPTESSVVGLCYWKDMIYALLTTKKVLVLSSEGVDVHSFTVELSKDYCSCTLTVVSDMLFIPDGNTIKRYSLTGDAHGIITLRPADRYMFVAAADAFHIIMCSEETYHICKINVVSGAKEWCYDLEASPTDVTVDASSANVYVTTSVTIGADTVVSLTVLSPEGQLLQTLKLIDDHAVLFGISLSKDQLIVAHETGIDIYRID